MTSLVSRARGAWPELGRGPLAALAVFVVLIVFMMWPQVLHIRDSATAIGTTIATVHTSLRRHISSTATSSIPSRAP